MGSFNIVCSVSNISISSGDPIVFIPLEVAKYPYKVGDGNHTLISSHCFYANENINPAKCPQCGSRQLEVW